MSIRSIKYISVSSFDVIFSASPLPPVCTFPRVQQPLVGSASWNTTWQPSKSFHGKHYFLQIGTLASYSIWLCEAFVCNPTWRLCQTVFSGFGETNSEKHAWCSIDWAMKRCAEWFNFNTTLHNIVTIIKYITLYKIMYSRLAAEIKEVARRQCSLYNNSLYNYIITIDPRGWELLQLWVAELKVSEMGERQYSICGKTRGSAMYFNVFLTKPVGQWHLWGLRGTRGVNRTMLKISGTWWCWYNILKITPSSGD